MTKIKADRIITTKDMWSDYIDNLLEELEVLKNDYNSFNNSRKYLLTNLDKYIELFGTRCNITLDNMKILANPNTIIKINYDISPILAAKLNINKQTIDKVLEPLVLVNQQIKLIKNRITQIEKNNISFEEYEFIIKKFNTKLTEKIIQGYIFKTCFGVQLQIIKRKRLKANIDWNESNKIKKQLLLENKEVYNKETNPNGVKWFSFHTSDYVYYWYWKKNDCVLKNQVLYSFLPVRGSKNNVVGDLVKYVNSDNFLNTVYENG